MGKQIVSLILTLVLSFGYTGRMFAGDPTSQTQDSAVAVLEQSRKLSVSKSAEEICEDVYSSTSVVFQDLLANVKDVYVFQDGKLTSIMGADRTVRIYLDGKEKLTVKKLSDEISYSVTAVNLDDIDAQAFANYKKRYPDSSFSGYLQAAFGIEPDTANKISKVTDDKEMSVEEFLTSGFKSGLGAEVALTLDTNNDTKTTLTFSSPAGKKLETRDYLGNITGQYVYENGTSVPTKYIKIGEVNEETGETTVTVTEFSDGTSKYQDERSNIIPTGQPAYTWEGSVSSKTVNSSSGLQTSVANVKIQDRKRTTSYVYDPKTNQKISETNLSTGEKTVYSNGKPVAVYYKPADDKTALNLKQKITYGSNGNMQSIVDYADNSEHTQTKIFVYADDGTFICSGTSQSEATLRKQRIAIEQVINKPGVTAQEILDIFAANPDITSFDYSWPQLQNNKALFQAIFTEKNADKLDPIEILRAKLFSSSQTFTKDALDELLASKAITKALYDKIREYKINNSTVSVTDAIADIMKTSNDISSTTVNAINEIVNKKAIGALVVDGKLQGDFLDKVNAYQLKNSSATVQQAVIALIDEGQIDTNPYSQVDWYKRAHPNASELDIMKNVNMDAYTQFAWYQKNHPTASISETIKALVGLEEQDKSLSDPQRVWKSLGTAYDRLTKLKTDFTVNVGSEKIEDPSTTVNKQIVDRKNEGVVKGRDHMGDTHDGQDVDRGAELFQSGV
ncbi:MAG: hypothetical protein LBF23_00145, partial [Endomicrobium sp.]|nr:hypothetical protein [Endomicrobium sp.]